MLEREHEYEKMAAAENHLWWYRCLHSFVLKELTQVVGQRDAAVVDAGCGTGGLLSKLQSAGFSNLRGFDVSKHALARVSPDIETACGSIDEVETLFEHGSIDAFVCNDVLYFIPPERRIEVLTGFRKVLRRDGSLILNVPVYPAFAGMHDISVGLRDRPKPNELTEICRVAGFEIRKSFCWPFLLSPLVAAVRYTQRCELRRTPDVEIVSDVEVPPAPINELLYGITQLERRLELGYWGSSWFASLKAR